MRPLLVIELIAAALILGVFVQSAAGDPGPTGPAAWPTPNPDPSWYYYDLGPFDDASYQPVTIGQILADPFQYDGQLIRVQGRYVHGEGLRPPCPPPTAVRTPTVEPGFLPLGLSTALADPSGELGVLIWGKQDDTLWPRDELAYTNDQQIELRGILRASYRNPSCDPARLIASAYLAIQRTDPVISFTMSAQDVGRTLTAPPSGNTLDDLSPTATPSP